MTSKNKFTKDENYLIISESEFFDKEWYGSNYDLGDSDAALHYLHIGFKEGFNPGPIFSTVGYYECNPDVAENGMNPLLHYEVYGCKEGRTWEITPYANVDEEIAKYYNLTSNKQRILLAGHDCNNAGAQILLKNIIFEFKKRDVEVAVLVKNSGPLLDTYKDMAPTFIIENENKIKYYVSELSKYGYKSAILNTVISGDLIPILHEYGYYSVNLIHELPGMIKLLNAEEFVKIIAEQSDTVIFPSSFVAEKFEEIFEVKGKKLVQPQGLYNYYQDFKYEESRKKLEKKYDIPSQNNIILNVGTGELRKGFDLFLEVSKKLSDENFSFIWVGGIDEEMAERYCNGIDDKNIILPGFIDDKTEIMDFYAACDVFMLTSREDPYPSVVLEAFNAKKPVVAFENAGGFKDIVINNETGFLVGYESVDEMIDKIKLICNDDDLKEKLGNNAKDTCDRHDFSGYVEFLILYCMYGEEIIALKNDIKSKNETIIDIKTIDKQKTNQISNLNAMNTKKNATISKLKTKNKKLTTKNKKLTKQNDELLNSSSWKLTKPLRQIKSKVSKIKSPSKSTDKIKSSKKNKSLGGADKKVRQDKEIKYSFIDSYPFSYKIYLIPEKLNRVNLFFDKIDNDIYKFKNLFSFIIRYCDKFEYDLRIIYKKADFDVLKNFLKKYELVLPENSSFLNLKDNYLEITLDEKNICTSWQTAKRLINTQSLDSIIYFYLDDLNEYLFEDAFQISKICYDDNVVILNDDKTKLESLRNYYYDFEININREMSVDKKVLCCDFGDMIIEGIDLLNYLFTNKILDINQWEINIISPNKISKCYKDSKKHIKHIPEKLADYDLFLKFEHAHSEELVEDNCIGLFIKDVVDESYNSIEISDYDFEMFNTFSPSESHSSSFLQIGEIFNKINGED